MITLIKKYPILVNLSKNYYNPKNTNKEGKIPSIRGLATTSAINSVEYKIPKVSGLVKKNKFSCKKIRYLY